MIGRRAARPLTAEEIRQRNTERNIARIMNPPEPSLRDRVERLPLKVQRWWWEHVTHRDLHRRLDNLRVDLTALQRLASTPPGQPEDTA